MKVIRLIFEDYKSNLELIFMTVSKEKSFGELCDFRHITKYEISIIKEFALWCFGIDIIFFGFIKKVHYYIGSKGIF